MAETCNTCPDNTPEAESLQSQVSNLILHFFGSLTKVDGGADTVNWVLPCNMSEEEPIPGHPRLEGEGIGCFLLRILEEGVTGLDGADAFATVTADYVQPAVGEDVEVSVSTVAPFSVNQYVWNSDGSFYTISAVGVSSLTLTNLYSPPNNVSAGATIATGTKISPSGVPETAGPQGVQGPIGATGPIGPTGSVWRDGAGVPSNGLGVDGDYYLNETNGDFYLKEASVYTLQGNIRGPEGPAGPAADVVLEQWSYNAPGEHRWIATFDGDVRFRVYGAGGGGGSGVTAGGTGFGAGGGEYADAVIAVVNGTTYQLFVGEGGDGGTGGDNSPGAAGVSGGVTYVTNSVTTLLEAIGGLGGGNGVDGAVGVGGSGGAGSATNRFSGYPGIVAVGGRAGRDGAGGFSGNDGESPGGGGSGGIAGGTPGGGQGGHGRIVLEILP